ncbi:MAG TPA: response regulator [Actinomycetota bacterium]|nr:response regulator [Actinomycetota bacterium]
MGSPPSAPRVLVVDDDPAIVRLLEVNFRLEGFEVDATTRGERAVELARAAPPDAVVLDVMMPGLDGWEVCRRLRDEAGLAGVPIVFLSARPRDVDPERGYASGVVAQVTKPFEPLELVALVRRAIEDARRG